MKRPAEMVTATFALAILVGRLAGIKDPDTLTAMAVVLGLVPAGVTTLVANGGLVGAVRKLWGR